MYLSHYFPQKFEFLNSLFEKRFIYLDFIKYYGEFLGLTSVYWNNFVLSF